jgi:hypothetical protein
MKSPVIIFFLLCFQVLHAQDYIVKKNGDTVYGKILDWKVNQVSIKTVNGKYSSFKPSNSRSYHFGERKITFRSTDVVNRMGKIFLPETGSSAKRFFFYSGPDSIKMLKIDTFTIYVLQVKNVFALYNTALTWTVKTNRNRLFINIDDFAADRIYIATPSTGIHCIYHYQMSGSFYQKSFDLMTGYFEAHKQLVVDMFLKRNTDTRQTERPEFIYDMLYAFFGRDKLPEFKHDEVDAVRFPF